MFAGNFAPVGWAFCDGSLIPISENDALFNLIGTTYGGDGQNTFALPDLRGRVPVHQGQGQGLSSYIIGQYSGVETVTLTTSQIPLHSHVPQGNSAASNSSNPAGMFWGASSANAYISAASANASVNATALGPGGGSQPHENRMPYLAINFIISLFGIYPTPT